MKYMVMECHPGFAVVLDEQGRFLKVVNRNYTVGQQVTEVIALQLPETASKTKNRNRWIYSLSAMAACLVLIVVSVFSSVQVPYASVYMAINPEVRIDVNQKDVVVGLDGVNADGKDLIEGYSYQRKDLNLVMDELVDRAIDMGYLHEGGQISLTLDAENDEWIVANSGALSAHLNDYLKEKISVTIEVTDKKAQSNQVVIPVTPDEYGESDYGEEKASASSASSRPSAGSSEDGETDYDDREDSSEDDQDDSWSDYGTSSDSGGQSNYGESEDGRSNYGEQDTGDDSQSNYGTQKDSDDGSTNYEEQESPEDGLSDYDDEED